MKKLMIPAIALVLFCGTAIAQQTSTTTKTEDTKVAKHKKAKKHRFENGTADAPKQATSVSKTTMATGQNQNTNTTPQAAKKVAPSY